MKWTVLPYSESYFEETKDILVEFFNFSVLENTIKRIAFENAYESSIIFQPLLYANVPAESLSYAPTLFDFPLTKNTFGCLVEISRVVLDMKIFQKLSIYFYFVAIISP